MVTIGERIKYLRLSNGLTMADISERIDVTKASMSSYENNKYDPSAQIVVKLCEFFHITADWLLTGKGEMSPSFDPPTDPRKLQDYQQTVAQTFFDNLTSDQVALIDCYEKLNDEEKEEIWVIIKHKLSRKTGLDSSFPISKNGENIEDKTA